MEATARTLYTVSPLIEQYAGDLERSTAIQYLAIRLDRSEDHVGGALEEYSQTRPRRRNRDSSSGLPDGLYNWTGLINVTRAIPAASNKVATHSPVLDDHVLVTIHTRTFCACRPDPRSWISWQLVNGTVQLTVRGI